MVQAIINLQKEANDFLEIFKTKKRISNKCDAINQIIIDYKELEKENHFNQEMNENDLEMYEITKELEKKGYFGTEKDLEKYGIKF